MLLLLPHSASAPLKSNGHLKCSAIEGSNNYCFLEVNPERQKTLKVTELTAAPTFIKLTRGSQQPNSVLGLLIKESIWDPDGWTQSCLLHRGLLTWHFWRPAKSCLDFRTYRTALSLLFSVGLFHTVGTKPRDLTNVQMHGNWQLEEKMKLKKLAPIYQRNKLPREAMIYILEPSSWQDTNQNSAQ